MKLKDAVEIFLAAKRIEISRETEKWYLRYLAPLRQRFDEQDVTRLDTAELQTVFGEIAAKPISRFTLANYLRVWRHFFRYLHVEGLIQANPCAKLPRLRIPPKTPAAISEVDIQQLLKISKHSKHPERDYALLCILADTGARVGGIAGLLIQDIDLDRRRAIVREKGRGGKKERLVFFSLQTANAIREWLKVRPESKEDQRLFLLKESGIYQVLERLAARAEIKGRWNPHSFRHAFARRMLAKGMSIGIVSQLLGHSSVQVTIDFYGRFSNDELQQIYDAYMSNS